MNKYAVRLLKVVLLSAFVTAGTACDRKKGTGAVSQDSMLLRDLDQANRDTPAIDTTSVVVRERSEADDPALVDVGGSPSDGPVPRSVPPATSSPSSAPPVASAPSSASPRVSRPRRAADAPAPTVVPPRTNRPVTDDPCTSPAQSDQRQCIMNSLARSDWTLNRVYQELIQEIRRSGSTEGGASEQRLRVAQREWLVYRDTECRRRTRDREGDLWAPVRAKCLGDFSSIRTAELRQNLSDIRGR